MFLCVPIPNACIVYFIAQQVYYGGSTVKETRSFEPTLAWEEAQRDIAHRMRPSDIANFILNKAPWARSQQFSTILRREAYLRDGCSLLDAGCGTGQLGFAAAIYGGAKVTLLDYSEEALNFAREVARELRNRGERLNVDFVRGDLRNLGFVEEFDIVTNQGVLEHWPSFEERFHVLSEMVKATKKGGSVIIWVPNNHNPIYRRWIQKHVEVLEWAFSARELHMLFSKVGLKKVKVFPVTAYKTFSHYVFPERLKWIGGAFWLLEVVIPRFLLKHYKKYFGYELVAVGYKLDEDGV